MQIKIQINEKQGVNPSTQHEAVKNQHARHNITYEWLRLSSHKSHKSHLTGVYSAFAMNAALNIVTCPRARVHFTVACLVAKPLNRSEAKDDLVMIQTSLLFKKTVFITTWSPSTSLQMKGLATKYTTVTWPIVMNILIIIALKTKRQLRTKSRISLAYLATTDFAVGLVSQPLIRLYIQTDNKKALDKSLNTYPLLSGYYQYKKKFCHIKELRHCQLNAVYENRIDYRIVSYIYSDGQ